MKINNYLRICDMHESDLPFIVAPALAFDLTFDEDVAVVYGLEIMD